MQSDITKRWLRFFAAYVVCGVLLLTSFALLTGCERQQAAAAPPAPEVQVADVIQQDVPVYNEWVAQLDGPVNADITPKVQGYVLAQAYRNGTFVKKGQLLFELDAREYQAQVEKAKADVAQSKATLERFQNDVARDTPLAAQNAIPHKQLDNDIANVNATKAKLQADEAALQNAELNLAWTKIYSPIDGIAGDAKSQVGDLVGTATKMTTVSRVDPIWANFNISEAAYLDVAQRVAEASRAGRAGRVPVEYIQANAQKYPHLGKIVQVNREITAGTGTIQFTAEFPNPEGILRPGGFGRVRIQTADHKNALLIPQIAVIEVQSQYQVLVVSPDNKAKYRPVKVGQRSGPNWIITDGLKPGERVVAEGIMKVQQAAAASPKAAEEGIPVTPKHYETVATTAEGN